MQVGMIGAGRMGTNLVRRLLRERHECVVYDADSEAVSQVETYGALGATSIPDLVSKLQPPRVVWVMVPAALTGEVVDELAAELAAGDVVIDGGNSYYRDAVTRADALAEHGIDYVDVGTSGGVFGLDRGFCLMIGGKADVVARLDPVFRALAPGVDVAARTPGRVDEPSTEERGYLHCGPAGAGHFVKMVHNGIEYGQMAALAEGLAILRKANIGMADRENSAEAAPLGDAQFYRYAFDTAAIAEVWRRGSVISSWLVDLTAAALRDDPELAQFTGQVADSGEGRWTVQAAVDEGVPAYVLTAALYERFSSRNEGDYADKALSAMRKAFGGHMEVGSNR